MRQKSELHQYQLDVLKLGTIVPNLSTITPNLGLFMEPGLGKTVTALTLIAESPPGRTLIVAPKRVAESVWAEECQQWAHLAHLSASKVMGTPKERLAALEVSVDLYITNVENLVWLTEQGAVFDYLIVDESSRFKDPSSKRFKALKKVLKDFKRRFILTGTPTPQGYADLWSQVGILDLGQRLGKSMTGFRETYMHVTDRNQRTGVVYAWGLNDGAAAVIEGKIKDICVSLKASDYLQLPPLMNVEHRLPLDADVMAKYKELKKTMVAEIAGDTVTAVTAAVLAGKLLQFTSGAVYNEEKEALHVHDTKIEFLESIIEEAGGAPTIIFYNFQSSLARLQRALPYGRVLQTSYIEPWREGRVPVLFAHPQSGGIGLNLQCNTHSVAHCVWFDLPWSSELYIQANARVYRQGQLKPVVLHHLIAADTIDEQVLEVLAGKINTQDALLSALNLH